MSTSKNKNPESIANKRSSDPFDKLIFEKGIRIQQFIISKELNLIVLLLTNSAVIKVGLKHFPRFKNATKEELEKAEIKGDGIGIRWSMLDEDISLKGLIKEVAMTEALSRLQSKDKQELAFV
ncbi:MAG: DUF2442 domain-containing protein [Phormidesmis sp. FL-bin-119]|nr:DUF2442 domain-containing protein [Pedobacter sp.]